MAPDKDKKLIPLTLSKYAIVDADVYEELSKYKWYSMLSGNKYYAARNVNLHNKHTLVLMHRQIMNAPSDKSVEHVNCDSLDNRKDNLRLCQAKEIVESFIE